MPLEMAYFTPLPRPGKLNQTMFDIRTGATTQQTGRNMMVYFVWQQKAGIIKNTI